MESSSEKINSRDNQSGIALNVNSVTYDYDTIRVLEKDEEEEESQLRMKE